MKRRLFLTVVMSTLLLAGAGLASAQVLFNFDELAAPDNFDAAEPITDVYADQGVTFSGQGEILDEAGGFNVSGYSTPNILAFNAGIGVAPPETISFDPPLSQVSIGAGCVIAGLVTMTAYDADGVLLAETDCAALSTMQTLTIAADGIASIVLDTTGPIAVFDDLEIVQQEGAGPVELSMVPQNTVIPATGGTLSFDISLISTLDATYSGVSFWTMATLPNGQEYGPLMQIPFTLTPQMNVSYPGATQAIPAMAPGGDYTLSGYAGYMNGPSVSDSFPFEKLGVSTDGVDHWTGRVPGLTASQENPHASRPTGYALSPAHPNPFNPATTVTVSLPEAADLSVTVFNSMGRQVAQLAAGSHAAGSHAFTLDGSRLASGVYLVRAQVPGEFNAVQKVVLMK